MMPGQSERADPATRSQQDNHHEAIFRSLRTEQKTHY